MASAALPRTLTVGPGREFRSIGAAIAAATPGSRIRVGAGTYEESLEIGSPLEITADQGALLSGPADGLIRSWGTIVRIEGLTVVSRPAGIGRRLGRLVRRDVPPAMIWVSDGRLELVRCDISGADDPLVAALGGQLALIQSRVHDGPGDGVVVTESKPGRRAEIERCDLSGFGSAAVDVIGPATVFVAGSRLRNARLAGVRTLDGGRVELNDVDVEDCAGAGVQASGEGSVAVLEGCRLASRGEQGAAAQDGGRIEVRGSTIGSAECCISVTGSSSTALVADSQVPEGTAAGIAVTDGSRAEVHTTEIVRCGRTGLIVGDPGTVAAISRCRVAETGGYGVVVGGDALTTVEESEVVDNLFSGVKVDGKGTRATISGTTITRNGGVSGGIVTNGAMPASRGNRIAALMAWRAVECGAPDSSSDHLAPPDLSPRGAPDGAPRPAVGARVGLGTVPTSLVLDANDAPWVAVPDFGVCRIDPASCRIDRLVEIRPPGVPGLTGLVFDLARGGDDLWAAYASFDPADDRQVGAGLARIDPAEGRVTRWIALDGTPGVLCIADGHAWVATSEPGALIRVSLATGGVATKVLDLRQPGPIVAGNGRIWAADRGAGTISAVGTQPGQGPSRIGVKDVNGLTLTPAGLVAAAPHGGDNPSDARHAIIRIDATAGRVVGERTGLGMTIAVAHGAAGLWAAPHGRVAELDPVTLETRLEVEVGTVAQRLGVGRQHVWVLYMYSVGFLSTEEVPGTLVRIDL